MLLAIDIGNTNVKIGIFQGGTLIGHSYVALRDASAGTKLGEFINPYTSAADAEAEAAIVSSVVPSMTEQVLSHVWPYFSGEPHIVSHRTNTGLSFSLPHPERLGADRIAAAAWGYSHFGAPAAVIDFGTATTISVVGRGGVFVGGAIVPGLRTMARSFSEHTAQLPHVELESPGGALGRDTNSAIISGIVYGTAGAVSRVVYEIERELGYNLKLAVTGGNLTLIEPFLERADVVEPALPLKALQAIYQRIREPWT